MNIKQTTKHQAKCLHFFFSSKSHVQIFVRISHASHIGCSIYKVIPLFLCVRSTQCIPEPKTGCPDKAVNAQNCHLSFDYVQLGLCTPLTKKIYSLIYEKTYLLNHRNLVDSRTHISAEILLAYYDLIRPGIKWLPLL